MTVHHQLKGSICRHTWVQAGDVTEQGLATIKQDVTNEYVATTGCQVSVADISYGMHPVSSHLPTEVSMFLRCGVRLTLPGLDKGESWCWC